MDLPKKNVALLLIGNELLSGKIQDTNGYYCAKSFRKAGITLAEVRIVNDIPEEIIAALQSLRKKYAFIITSGGIGPTHDDITLSAIAELFNLDLEIFPELLSALKNGYKDKFNSAVEKMAYLPSTAKLLNSPGKEWPLIQVENIYILPGVPILFKRKIKQICRLISGELFYLNEIHLNIDESLIAELLTELDDKYDVVDIGSYPMWPSEETKVRAKITFESRDAKSVDCAFLEFKNKISASIIEKVITFKE